MFKNNQRLIYIGNIRNSVYVRLCPTLECSRISVSSIISSIDQLMRGIFPLTLYRRKGWMNHLSFRSLIFEEISFIVHNIMLQKSIFRPILYESIEVTSFKLESTLYTCYIVKYHTHVFVLKWSPCGHLEDVFTLFRRFLLKNEMGFANLCSNAT